jgi:hypothetical protein
MNRDIKFRGFDKLSKKMIDLKKITPFALAQPDLNGLFLPFDDDIILMQFTGLLDNKLIKEIYEGDIIDASGNIIGNIYENEDLLKEKINIVVESMGTSKWKNTEQALNQRGCKYAK